MDSVEPPITTINSNVVDVKQEPSSPFPEAEKIEISVNQIEFVAPTRVSKRIEQWQKDILCDAFTKNPYPKSSEIQKLAAQAKRTEDQVRNWFTLRRKTQGIRKNRSTSNDGPVAEFGIQPHPCGARDMPNSVSNKIIRDAAEEQLILFPDLQSIIPQLRQLVMKFPYQVETKVSTWSKALNIDEDRVRAWINWLGEQHPSTLSLSHRISSSTDSQSVGRPVMVVPQREARLPTPSESPEPQRLSIGSLSDTTEWSPLFSNPFTSPSSPLPPLLPPSPVEPMSQISGPSNLSGMAPIQSSPVERHIPMELRTVSEPISAVTAVAVAQPRRVTVPGVSWASQHATSSTSRDYAPTSAVVPNRSTRFIHIFGAPRPIQAAVQPGNASIGHSVPAAPIASSTVSDSRGQTSTPATLSSPFPPFRIPEKRSSVQVHQDPDPEIRVDHFREVSEASAHILPPRIQNFDAFRHFVRGRQLLNDAAPSSSPSDSPELLRQLEDLGQTASEILLRMRS